MHSQDGLTALHLAAQNGHVESVRELLGKGAAVNQASEVSTEFKGLHVERALMHVLPSWFLHDVCMQDGRTPLLLAAKGGHFECVRALLNAGAAVNQASNVSTAQ